MVPYRGRIAPSPTGLLHLGHARTFWEAGLRARRAGGVLLLRIEDLDGPRSRPEFTRAALEDLRWFGLDWQEGPDTGGPCAPYLQSERRAWHQEIWQHLHRTGLTYPCARSRRDVQEAAAAPHHEGEEPVFPPSWRPPPGAGAQALEPGESNWRFRVPDGRCIEFVDARRGRCAFTAGVDFGDFLLWRRDGVPSYQLAVVADDHAMGITEVVRGEDLLLSTARQILLYEALGWAAPSWCHTPLLRDSEGRRLAKRDGALSLQALRQAGRDPAALRTSLGLDES